MPAEAFHSERLEDGRTIHVRVERDRAPITYADAIAAWRDDAGFRQRFAQLLADAPFTSYCWETPPVTRATLDRPFEFVLIDSPTLARMSPDPAPFAEHFDAVDATGDVTAFPNLGGDAYLIVPSPRAAATAYPHLAAFARNAPHAQQDALWHAVGLTLDARVGNRPIWLSTAGLGVAWVHVRLDTSPKYYRHGPYLAGR